MKSLTPMPGD